MSGEVITIIIMSFFLGVLLSFVGLWYAQYRKGRSKGAHPPSQIQTQAEPEKEMLSDAEFYNKNRGQEAIDADRLQRIQIDQAFEEMQHYNAATAYRMDASEKKRE